jgi:ABC-type nitrate/sulfonate/bicarbonate transport system substrate-binding protein
LEEVTIQLHWYPSASFAGFYTAQELGFYEERGLSVNILEGGLGVDVFGMLQEDEAQFAVAVGDAVMQMRSQGQDLVAVGAVFRKNPLVVMTLEDSGLTTPQDLAGKRVGVIAPGELVFFDVLFREVLVNAGVDPESVTYVPLQMFSGAQDLLSGEMDAATGTYVTTQPVEAEVRGNPVNTIFYVDYGVPAYVDTIFTSGALVEEDPDLVERFVQATFEGYRYAIENPEEAVDYTMPHGENLEREVVSAGMKAQIPFIDTGEKYLGWMDRAIWEYTQELLLKHGMLEEPVDIDELFTNEFLAE